MKNKFIALMAALIMLFQVVMPAMAAEIKSGDEARNVGSVSESVRRIFESTNSDEAAKIAETISSDYSALSKYECCNTLSEILDKYRHFLEHVYTSIDSEKNNINEIVSTDVASLLKKRAEGAKAYADGSGWKFDKAESAFEVKSVQEKENLFIISLYEWVSVFYTDNNVQDFCGFGFNHEITIDSQGEMIISDVISDDAFELPDTYNTEETNVVPKYTERADKSIATRTAYNASAAVSYADTYALSYNPNYSNYNSAGGDCANFVSQCLYAGGIPMDGKWYWYAYSNHSSSWTVCSSQISYFKSYGTFYRSPSASDILSGNPVWYYKSTSSSGNHSAICVGTNSSGTPVVDAHNNDRYHVAWTLGGSSYWPGGYSTVQITESAPTIETIDINANSRITAGSGVKLRSAPGLSTSQVGGIPYGTEVYVTKRTAYQIDGYTWAQTTYSGVTGWFALDYAEPVDNTSYTVVLHGWTSNDKMGDSNVEHISGEWQYLCYELYIEESGKPLNQVLSKNYTVTETLYEVDGSVAYTSSYENSDQNWIGIKRWQAGRYNGKIEVTGDITLTLEVGFTLVYAPIISLSADTLNLHLNGTNSATVTLTPESGMPGRYTYTLFRDTTMVSTSWGEWQDDNVISFYVTGLKYGSTEITIKMLEKYTGNDEEVAEIHVRVNIDADKYTISYNANGGNGAPVAQIKYYRTDIQLSSEIPSRSGHTFLGWSKNSSASSATYSAGATFSENANTILYAVWQANTYTVIFKDWNGTVLKTQTVNYGSSATAPANPTRNGYTFTGWDKSFTNVMNNLTVTAQYRINTYTVTFKDGLTGNTISEQTVEHGADAMFPTAPTHTGYTFKSWDSDGKNITADITITAIYEINTYTVTFMDGLTQTIITTIQVEHGKDATFPEAPEHTGYTFKSWDKDGKNVTHDMTIFAQYEINKYKVTFVDGLTGEIIAEIYVEYGHDVKTFPEAPEHEGYEFSQWDNKGTNIDGDTTITALYEPAILIGDVNGDSKINTADVVQVLKYVAGIIQLDEKQNIASDCNFDSNVNTADAVLILKYAAGMIEKF